MDHIFVYTDYGRVLVVGGETAEYLNTVELLDLTGRHPSCQMPSQFPLAVSGSVGGFIDGEALVCGGYNPDGGYLQTCWAYDNENNQWNQLQNTMLNQPRSVSVHLNTFQNT